MTRWRGGGGGASKRMDFISLFAGVGGFDLGFERAGMRCVAQVEWNKQATSVLKRHYPNVLRLGDVTHVGKHNLPSVDLICGGFPCTDVSVAGRRAGLAGKSSGYWFEFHRIIHEIKPEWIVIENVPGLLSSNDGKDFAVVLAGLTGVVPAIPKSGWGNAGVARGRRGLYHTAYRVLDAQYFGVAQRRRRVFIIANLGTGSCADVLFEQYSGGGNIAQSEGTAQENTTAFRAALENDSEQRESLTAWDQQNKRIHSADGTAPTVAGSDGGGGGRLPYFEIKPLHYTQDYNQDRIYDSKGIAPSLVAQHSDRSQKFLVGTLAASGAGTARPAGQGNELDFIIPSGGATQTTIRRLTPVECERLQGFPDNWTAHDANGNTISDSARYRMLGNAVCANVSAWIGKRLMSVVNATQKDIAA